MAGRYFSVILLSVACLIAAAAATTCTFRYTLSSLTYTMSCPYGCCSNACCTSTLFNSYADTASTAIQGWVIGVIVVGCLIGLAIIVCIIVCIVQATKSATRGTVIHPATAQPNVTVVSSGQQGTYPASYGPPGTVPPAYPYTGPDAAPNYGPKK